jgi:hypothetical protein
VGTKHRYLKVYCSVSDPYSLYADKDPGFETNANPDSIPDTDFETNADPDPNPDPDTNPGLKLTNFSNVNVFIMCGAGTGIYQIKTHLNNL